MSDMFDKVKSMLWGAATPSVDSPVQATETIDGSATDAPKKTSSTLSNGSTTSYISTTSTDSTGSGIINNVNGSLEVVSGENKIGNQPLCIVMETPEGIVFDSGAAHIVAAIPAYHTGIKIATKTEDFFDNHPEICYNLDIQPDIYDWGTMLVEKKLKMTPSSFKDGTECICIIPVTSSATLRQTASDLAFTSGKPVVIAGSTISNILSRGKKSKNIDGLPSSSSSSSSASSNASSNPSSPPTSGRTTPSLDVLDPTTLKSTTITWESRLKYTYGGITRNLNLNVNLLPQEELAKTYFESGFQFESADGDDTMRLLSASCSLRLPELSRHVGLYLQEDARSTYTRGSSTGNSVGGGIIGGWQDANWGLQGQAGYTRTGCHDESHISVNQFDVRRYAVEGPGNRLSYSAPADVEGNWLGSQMYTNWIVRRNNPRPTEVNFAVQAQYVQNRPVEGRSSKRFTACSVFNNLKIPDICHPTAEENVIFKSYATDLDSKHKVVDEEGDMSSTTAFFYSDESPKESEIKVDELHGHASEATVKVAETVNSTQTNTKNYNKPSWEIITSVGHSAGRRMHRAREELRSMV